MEVLAKTLQVKALKQSTQPQETPEQTFIRLAEKRMNNTLNNIRLIGNLANYPHSDEDTAKMFAALRSSIDACESLFTEKEKFNPKFSFGE